MRLKEEIRNPSDTKKVWAAKREKIKMIIFPTEVLIVKSESGNTFAVAVSQIDFSRDENVIVKP